MSTSNVANITHNKWLQQPGNTMTCLYEVTMDDMIRAFMKLKVVVRCGDPELLANAMKSYLGALNLNTRDCLLEGS